VCDVFSNGAHCRTEPAVESNHDTLPYACYATINLSEFLWRDAQRFFDEDSFIGIKRSADIRSVCVVSRRTDDKIHPFIGYDLGCIGCAAAKPKVARGAMCTERGTRRKSFQPHPECAKDWEERTLRKATGANEANSKRC